MERTKDVLHHVRSFHSKLADYYAQLERQAEKARVALLLQYLSRHEQHLADSLTRYEEKASRAVLDTWFQFTPDSDQLSEVHAKGLSPSMSCDEVVAVALEFDEMIVELYRDMAASARSPEVRELFENLLQMEKNEELQLMRNTLSITDL